jgi:hypothetical protein
MIPKYREKLSWRKQGSCYDFKYLISQQDDILPLWNLIVIVLHTINPSSVISVLRLTSPYTIGLLRGAIYFCL